MTTVLNDPRNVSFDKENKIYSMSEKYVRFDTSYELKDIETKECEIFEFTHSTGAEFDPNTIWIYKSKSGSELHVCNDARITEIHAKNYLEHKLRYKI